ncbi:hypothetical protein KF707_17620 [Candidatus Obscuribacterales bacterium]|nr:hypothetical protein [Candidatus Obscuribacterales bacterium]MBX3153826.1 hypothetical protein [Candidatus Obscuribacterales bacterium]
MSNLAILASVIMLSSSGSVPSAAGIVSDAPTPVVASAVNTLPAQAGDDTIQTAVDILNEARKAVKINDRRNRMKPGIQDRVVKQEKTKTDKMLIMGGKDAFPM